MRNKHAHNTCQLLQPGTEKKESGGLSKRGGRVGNGVRSKETTDENRALLEFIFEFH